MPDSLDLGTIEKPVWIFGGVYGNLQALDALIQRAEAAGITPDYMICTGDVAAYCADAEAVANRMRTLGIANVMGNCEETLGADADDCGCGFDEGSSCDALAKQWYAYCAETLSAESKAWMRDCPRRIDFNLAGKRFAVIHGAPSRINRFIFRSTPAEMKAAEINRTGADAVIGGHCGLPFIHDLGGRLWLNAGVIGMPANDGTPRTWYATLTPTEAGIDIRIEPLTYDFEGAAAAMHGAGLPAPYRECLTNGLWPSVDVLPLSEANQTGLGIQPKSLLWNG